MKIILNKIKIYIHKELIKIYNILLCYIFIIRYKFNLYNQLGQIEYNNSNLPIQFIDYFGDKINSIWKDSFSWGFNSIHIN